jgi:predicted RND superfamily exporter protein
VPKDIITYGIAATLLSALLLWARFRRVSGIVLPLLVTIPPVVGTLACMAVLGIPLQLPSAVLPPLVVVISVAGVVHVLSDLDRRVSAMGGGREAVLATLNDKAEALVIAALTTAIGMLSLAFTSIEPAAVVGRFGTLAALLGLLSTVLVVPAWCRLMPWTARVAGPSVWNGALRLFARLASRHSTVIVVLSVLTLAVGGAVDSQLRFGHDPVRWLPAAWDARQGVALLDERMHITMDLDVVVDTGATDGVLDPQSVRQLRALQQSVQALGTGPTRSLVDHLDDTRALLDDTAEYTDDAEGSRRLQRHLRLLRLSAGPVVDGLITPDGRYLRLLVRTDFVDASAYAPLIDEVKAAAERDLEGKTYFLAGLLPMFAATLAALSSSASIAWPLAVLGGGVMMVVIARSGRLGLLLLIPNLLPPVVALAVLRVVGLPLDIFTLLTVSLAMGVVVDDSIHLVTTFRQQLIETPDPSDACIETLQAAGPPIVLTTVLLVSGWLTLLLSPIPALWMFALVSSGTLAMGLVADLLLTPAVVLFWARHLRVQ